MKRIGIVIIIVVELIALAIMANFYRAEQVACRALPVVTSYTLANGCRVQYAPGEWMSGRDWQHFGKYLFPQIQIAKQHTF